MLIDQLVASTREQLVTIRDDAPLIEAVRHLHGRETNLVVVCDVDGMMVGVISKTDVVAQIGRCQGSSCTTAASAVVTRDVTYCHLHTVLGSVWERMKARGLKHIPIVDRELSPLGVLNARQAVQALLEELGNEEELMRDYVMGIG